MKFVLFHEGGEQKKAEGLMGRLKDRHIEAGVFSVGKEGDGFEPLLGGALTGASHFVFISSGSFFPPWVNFIAGYSFALELPLLLYGGKPDYFAPSKYLIPIKNEGDFLKYLEGELAKPVSREKPADPKYELLEAGIPFNEESMAGSVIGGNEKALSLFLEAGFSPNTRDKFGVPLLILAARMGNRSIVNLLVKAGAQVNQQAGDRLSTALIDGVSGKHYGIVEDLLAAGADVNLKTRDGQSALIIAVGLNDETSAEMLLRAGADADDPDSLGASGRQYAALFKKPAMLILLDKYAPQKSAG
jgi:hypothetical protein